MATITKVNMSTHPPPTFIPHISTFLPVYHWFGARPQILDLERHEKGWLLALVLQREGECCLTPLAWLYEQPHPDDERISETWPLSTESIHKTTLEYQLRQWQLEGWELCGRIEITFTGTETDSQFWPTIHSHLWNT